MILIIDGDNSPGTNVRKLGQLDESDIVFVYYASDNGYFTKESNRTTLIENTLCNVIFKCITAGNCAVDLAVAMDLGTMLHSLPGKSLVLVSKDKHFKIIQNLVKSNSPEWYVAQVDDIDDAIRGYKVLETASLTDFHNWLVYMFGSRNGNEMYARVDEMFMDKYVKSRTVTRIIDVFRRTGKMVSPP